MSDDSFSLLDDDAPDEDDTRDESGLSQHPEAVRARERREKGYKRKPKKGASTPRRRRVPTSSEITSRLRESLDALANALEDRDPELARVLHRDGPKMADLLGKWGDHPKTPPPVKVAVVVIAEVLEPLRAFGATVRILLRRFRERRLREPEPVEGVDFVRDSEGLAWSLPDEPTSDDTPVPPTPPERFRIDVEPPEVN
jgi:hypothetical protein